MSDYYPNADLVAQRLVRVFWSSNQLLDKAVDGLHPKGDRTIDSNLPRRLTQATTYYSSECLRLRSVLLPAPTHFFGIDHRPTLVTVSLTTIRSASTSTMDGSSTGTVTVTP